MNRRPEPYGDWRVVLSKKDKVGYILIEASLTLLSLFFGLVYLTVKSVIAFWDESTLASVTQTGTYWVMPLFLFIIATVCYIDSNLRRKGVLLFKNKNTDCCHSSKKEHVIKREKKAKAKTIILWFLIFVICVLFCLPGFFSRIVMDKDGNLHIYNSFNKQTRFLASDDVVSLSVNATQYRRKTSEETAVWITVYYKDGKEYSFDTESFIGSEQYTDREFEGMIKIKRLLSHADITINGKDKLDNYAETFELSERDKELLYKLFE